MKVWLLPIVTKPNIYSMQTQIADCFALIYRTLVTSAEWLERHYNHPSEIPFSSYLLRETVDNIQSPLKRTEKLQFIHLQELYLNILIHDKDVEDFPRYILS